MPAHPFFLPDAALLILAMYLFVEIGGVLDIDRVKAAIIFLAAVLVPPTIFKQFVIPWTTTPAMVLIAAVLLAGLRYCEAPARRWAFAAGACGASLLLFRPSDLVVLVPVIAFCGTAAARNGGSSRVLQDGALFSTGFALPAAIAFGIYLAINGPYESAYLHQAAGLGFDVTQLPVKWVTIFLDPKPLYLSGEGVLRAYPWVCFGIIGAVQFSIFKQSGRHALVAAVMLAYSALYLSYVDLLPTNLWDFNVIHYFKWLFPFLALFAFLALRSLRDRENRRSFAAALVLSAIPLNLHITLVPTPRSIESSDGQRTFVLDVSGPADVIDVPLSEAERTTMYPAYLPAARAKADTQWIIRPLIDNAPVHHLQIDGKALAYIRDFHVFAAPSGARIVLLRHPVGHRIAAELAEGNMLSRQSEVRTYSASLGIGWPAWLRFGDVPP